MSDKKKFKDIANEFLDFIKDKRLIIHNSEFDLAHLNNELFLLGKNKLNNEIICLAFTRIERRLTVDRSTTVGSLRLWGPLRATFEFFRFKKDIHLQENLAS